MNLKEIFIKAKGILSHAELNFYLCYVSHADENGFCFPRMKTVAAMLDVLPQNASRLFKKLVKLDWLLKVKNGVLCLVGFPKSNHSDYFSQSETNHGDYKTNHSDNFSDAKSNHGDNSSNHGDYSHIKELTNHLTNQKKPKREQLSAATTFAENADSIPKRIPAEFPITSEMRRWAKNHKTVSLIEDLEDATEKWHLHWSSASGERATSSDWIATWKKGMLNHYDYEQRKSRAGANANSANSRAGGKSAPAAQKQPGADQKDAGKSARRWANKPAIVK